MKKKLLGIVEHLNGFDQNIDINDSSTWRAINVPCVRKMAWFLFTKN